MVMSRYSILLLALLIAPSGCVDASVDLTALYPPPDASATPDLSGMSTIDPFECGFESADLAPFGYPGEVIYVAPEGGKVAIVEEGANYSALAGEQGVSFHGDYALLIRSNDAGDPDSSAVVRTLPFVPQNPFFVVDQMSEVGEEGVELSVRVLTPDLELLEEWSLPVVTGGYVPALEEGHQPIEGFPQITLDSAEPGIFVRQYLETSPWQESGEEIVLEFWQHTLVENNGFFTLFDNLCDGLPDDI
jgi:hypothetical protein